MDEPSDPRTKIRTIVVFSMMFAVLGAVVVFAFLSTFSRPITTVILVRHAEKNIEPDNPNPALSPAGQARAQELVRVLGNAGITAIYATHLLRTQQTVEPLANHLNLQVTKLDAGNIDELVRQIITNQQGGVVFVAGHNNTVPPVITALGGGTLPIISENEFDNLFVVTIYRSGQARVVKLKYGNASASGGGTGTMVR